MKTIGDFIGFGVVALLLAIFLYVKGFVDGEKAATKGKRP